MGEDYLWVSVFLYSRSASAMCWAVGREIFRRKEIEQVITGRGWKPSHMELSLSRRQNTVQPCRDTRNQPLPFFPGWCPNHSSQSLRPLEPGLFLLSLHLLAFSYSLSLSPITLSPQNFLSAPPTPPPAHPGIQLIHSLALGTKSLPT